MAAILSPGGRAGWIDFNCRHLGTSLMMLNRTLWLRFLCFTSLHFFFLFNHQSHLSLPIFIERRRRTGDTTAQTSKHKLLMVLIQNKEARFARCRCRLRFWSSIFVVWCSVITRYVGYAFVANCGADFTMWWIMGSPHMRRKVCTVEN